MAVTDLTNTKWVFSDYSIHNNESNEFYINFTSNNSSYTRLAYSDIGADDGIYYGNTRVAAWGDAVVTKGWIDQAYKTIEITNGTDVTNTDLINWFEENAIQITVTNLTNTKWLINSITCTAGYGQFNIQSNLYINDEYVADAYYLYIGYTIDGRPDNVIPANNSILHWSSLYSINEGNILEFIEGQDATNFNLISWLTAHATYIEPSSDIINTTISIGTNLLTDASVGTTKLLKAYIGNRLIFERLEGNFLTNDGKILMTSDNKIFNVQPDGYSGNIIAYSVAGYFIYTRIKFDTPPSNDDDYDASASEGSISGATNFSGRTKIYAWGYSDAGTPKVKINNVETTVSTKYAIPTEITLDGNYDIYLGYAHGSG